ncbi:MAG: hypothetical protein GYB67_19255, partial [Chloroflexi bacterium]|nr:hypothetical protein [Chloroflexota bacterium]
MAVKSPGSILAVDLGNIHTRAILLDEVDGRYYLVAQGETLTTVGFPIGDASVGVARAARQISATTGDMLVNRDGRVITPQQPDRSGVDLVVVTSSIGRPLRTVLMGLVPDMSIASGQRATAGTYVEIVDTLSLDDDRPQQDQINAMVLARPDLIFITGGVEGGARETLFELADLAQLAIRLMPRRHQPLVLFAGNSLISEALAERFDPDVRVFTAENVRPASDKEALEAAQFQLAQAFDAQTGEQGLGFESIGRLSRLGILPTAQSYDLIITYLDQALAD